MVGEVRVKREPGKTYLISADGKIPGAQRGGRRRLGIRIADRENCARYRERGELQSEEKEIFHSYVCA